MCEYLSDGWVERLSTSLGLVPEAERAGPSPEAFWMEEQVGQPEKRAKVGPAPQRCIQGCGCVHLWVARAPCGLPSRPVLPADAWQMQCGGAHASAASAPH